MKKNRSLILLALILSMSLLLGGCAAATDASKSADVQTPETAQTASPAAQNDDTLIVYYSYHGATRRAAEHLAKLTGGTLYELTLAEPYSGDDYTVSDRVFAERDANAMPVLSGQLPDLSSYSRVLIGTPVWNSSLANPVIGYLQQTDLTGKTAALFWTYITSEGSTESDFARLVQGGTVAQGLALSSVNGMSDEKLDQRLSDWLNALAQ